MRPVKLSITAFGPFINKEIIEFDAFGDNPLFLINGTTGSGKTTILDAICFSLYGQTTGNEREAMQMRCDFAPDDLLTEVEFIFELAGKHYRILRIPEQTRNKSKGEGTTKQVASAELSCFQLDDNDKKSNEELLVARKVSDATHNIEEITGLKVDQFRQVMVLPQGKFRKLLIADSKDRENIFSQLFETHIYKRIEDRLRSQANKVHKRVEELKDNQKGILQSVDFENISKLDEAIEKLKPEVEKISADLDLKETNYLNALRNIESAKELEQSFINLSFQQEQLKKLEHQEKEFEGKQKQLQLGEIAEKISPAFNVLSKLLHKHEEAEKQLNEYTKLFENSLEKLQSADIELSKNTERVLRLEGLKTELLSLLSYESKAYSLGKEIKNKESIQFSFDKIEQQYNQVSFQLNESLNNQEKAISDKQLLENSLNEGADLKLNLNIVNDQLNKRKKYENIDLKIEGLVEELQEIVFTGKRLASELKEKELVSKKLEYRWYQAQASVLARELREGEECPVCGSVDHPLPASNGEYIPSEEEREKAIQEIELSNKSVKNARDLYTTRNAELKSLRNESKELQKDWNEISRISLIDLENQHQKLLNQINQHENQQEQLKKLSERLSNLKLKEVDEREKLEQVQKEKSDLNAARQVNIELLKSLEKELPEEYRVVSFLEKAISKTKTEIEDLDSKIKKAQESQINENNLKIQTEANLASQKVLMKSLSGELEIAQETWDKEFEESGLDNKESFKNALLSDEKVQSIKLEIETYNKEIHEVSAVIANQSSLLDGKSKPDILSIEVELKKTLEIKLAQEQLCKEKSYKLNQFLKAQETLTDINNKQIKEENEYKTIGTLSNVANGTTGNKISLQRFVLSVILDDVLVDASHRLKTMTKGRYLLLRKEDRSKGNKASGLELEVEDSWTGKVRPVSTLSGGESFMASLSLALGLSSVVQAYAGGIHLNTLFVDEGFGSLDSGSLDEAIRVLTDLRDTGRMIGIISHVSELKEQIPLRLDVKTGDCGSYIELVNS